MKYQELKEGDVLIADDGFTCINAFEKCIVKKNEVGDFFVSCKEGKHYLDGQVDFSTDEIIGFSKVEK